MNLFMYFQLLMVIVAAPHMSLRMAVVAGAVWFLASAYYFWKGR